MSSHHAPTKWLVPNLIGEHTVNLIAGTSRTGKTALALPMLDQYASGEGMLDYLPSPDMVPRRLGALVLDRLSSSIRRELTSLECTNLMSPQTFPITELTPEVMGYAYRLSDSDKEPSTYNILRAVHQSLFGPPQILLIEAFDGLMPAGPTFPQVIRKFLIDCQTFCKDWDCTIIGTAPAIKQKMGEAAPAPMDVIAGHSSWGSGVSTAFVITYAQVAQMAPTLTRRLFISAPVVEDRYAYAKFDPRGRLELATRTHVDPLAETRAKLSKRLEMEKPGTSFRRNDFIGWGQELEISQRSVERWISEVIDLGMLEKYGRTVNARYQKPNPS